MSDRLKVWFYGVTIAAAIYVHLFLLVWERTQAAKMGGF